MGRLVICDGCCLSPRRLPTSYYLEVRYMCVFPKSSFTTILIRPFNLCAKYTDNKVAFRRRPRANNFAKSRLGASFSRMVEGWFGLLIRNALFCRDTDYSARFFLQRANPNRRFAPINIDHRILARDTRLSFCFWCYWVWLNHYRK